MDLQPTRKAIKPTDTISVTELGRYLAPLNDLAIKHCEAAAKATQAVMDLSGAIATVGLAQDRMKEAAKESSAALREVTRISKELALHLASVLPTHRQA